MTDSIKDLKGIIRRPSEAPSIDDMRTAIEARGSQSVRTESDINLNFEDALQQFDRERHGSETGSDSKFLGSEFDETDETAKVIYCLKPHNNLTTCSV